MLALWLHPIHLTAQQCWQLYGSIQGAYDDAKQTVACKMVNASALKGVQSFIVKRPPNW